MRPRLPSASEIPALWRAAADPRSAHRLAEMLLDPAPYAHTRGVAQQVARLVGEAGFSSDVRRQVLAASWLHDLGLAIGGGSLGAARALRASGNEELARIVAHQVGAASAAEFPPPAGETRPVLDALDSAIVTTDQSGGRVTPLEAVSAVAEACGAGDPAVRALVGRVAELGADPRAARWLRSLSPAAA